MTSVHTCKALWEDPAKGTTQAHGQAALTARHKLHVAVASVYHHKAFDVKIMRGKEDEAFVSCLAICITRKVLRAAALGKQPKIAVPNVR